MSINFASGLTVISSTWTLFKATAITAKSLAVQFEDDGTLTTVFAFDGTYLAYSVVIYDGVVPDGVIASGYSQAQNDADLADFRTNYQTTANARLNRADKFGSQVQTPFNYLAAQGVVTGLASGVIPGYVSTAATTAVPVRASAYTPGTVNAQRSIKSSDNTSDKISGTGARTVKITYFDQNMVGPKYDTVTMSGTSPVNTTATDICFIERMEVVTCGSGLTNVGIITLMSAAAGGGSSMGTILAGDAQTFWAHHYVPAGVTCYLFGLRSGATVAGLTAIFTAGSPLVVPSPLINITGWSRHGGSASLMLDVDWDTPIPVTGPNLVVVYEKPDTVSASTLQVGFDYLQY